MRNAFQILVGLFMQMCRCLLNLFAFFNVDTYLGHQRQPHGVGTRPSTFVSVPSYTEYHGAQSMRSQSVGGEGLPALYGTQIHLPCHKGSPVFPAQS
jgi:hypothetical protein